jgi:hypothetical protein
VLPRLPSNENNSFDHHNSYNKGPNLAFFTFTFPTYHEILKKSYHIFLFQQYAQNSNGQNLGIEEL